MTKVRCRISENGRVSIPAAFRKQLGLKSGDSVTIEVVDDELHIRSVHASVRRAQAMAREMLKQHPELSVDDFLAHRREDFDD